MKNKIHIIGLGHVDCGKTTLAAAISKIMAMLHGGEVKTFEEIDMKPDCRCARYH